MLTKQIQVPRGKNIGRAIIDSFDNFKYVTVISTTTIRDTTNRLNIVTIKFN